MPELTRTKEMCISLLFYFFKCLLLHARCKLFPVIFPNPKPAHSKDSCHQCEKKKTLRDICIRQLET